MRFATFDFSGFPLDSDFDEVFPSSVGEARLTEFVPVFDLDLDLDLDFDLDLDLDLDFDLDLNLDSDSGIDSDPDLVLDLESDLDLDLEFDRTFDITFSGAISVLRESCSFILRLLNTTVHMKRN